MQHDGVEVAVLSWEHTVGRPLGHGGVTASHAQCRSDYAGLFSVGRGPYLGLGELAVLVLVSGVFVDAAVLLVALEAVLLRLLLLLPLRGLLLLLRIRLLVRLLAILRLVASLLLLLTSLILQVAGIVHLKPQTDTDEVLAARWH